jgi:hypothetical protein
MSPIYCSACADALEVRPVQPTTDVLGTPYQLNKHAKHTSPSTFFPVQTVFDSSSTDYYADCISEAYQRGAVEFSPQGSNIIFCPSTGSHIGSKYKWGVYSQRQDTVLVVKSADTGETHAMLKASSDYSNRRCARCNGPAI